MGAEDPEPVVPPFDPDDLVRHGRFVKSLARELARDDDEADELAARTFETAFSRRPASSGSLRIWLKRVVSRLFLHARRDDARRRRREEAAAPREAIGATVDDVARLELERKVAAAFASLGEPYRTTLFLRFFDDLKPREIAARMHVPVDTVQTRTKRGLARLREALDEAHGHGRGEWRGVALALAKGGVVASTTAKVKVALAAAVLVLLAGGGWVALKSVRGGARRDADVAAAARADRGNAAGANAAGSDGEAAKTGDAVRSPDSGDALPYLAGVVVDEAGAPVEGAAIVPALLNRDDARNYYVVPLHVDRVKTSAVAWSGADGRFRLDDGMRDLVGVFAAKEGFGVGERFDLVAERAANQALRVVLPKPASLRGRVRDSEGRPVQFALITVHDPEPETRKRFAENLPGRPKYVSGFHWNELWTKARTDGSFEVDSIPAGAFTVGIDSWGYELVGFSAEKTEKPLDVVMRRGSLLVEVVDARTHEPVDEPRALFGIADPEQLFVDDAPIFHLKLGSQDPDDISPRNRLGVHPKTVEDWFKQLKRPRSAIRVQVLAPGHLPCAVDVDLPPEQEPPHLTVELEPGEDEPSLTGRILGAARVHLDVRFPCRDGVYSDTQCKAPVRSVDCDAEGRFAIAGLPAASYRLYASAPGRGQHEFDVVVPAHDLIFELKPAAAIEARVVDLEGNGAADVTVCVETRNEARSWIARTDATGTAVLEELPEGEVFIAAFRYPHDLAQRTCTLESHSFSPDALHTLASGQRTHVDLFLPEKRTIALRFTDARGNPLSDALVRFAEFLGSADWQEPGFREALWKSDRDPWKVESDGTLKLDLFPSHYEFTVELPGLDLPGLEQRVMLEVVPRGPSEFEFRLPIGAPTGSLHGRILEFGSGRPMADVKVCWAVGDGSRPAETLASAKTDAEGRFVFERVPAGPIAVIAWGPRETHGCTSKRLELAENGDLSLDLPVGRCHPDESTGARLATDITVVDDETGDPLTGSDVYFEAVVDGAHVGLSERETDRDGRARDEVTVAAHYQITAYSPIAPNPPYEMRYEKARLTVDPVDAMIRATIRLHRKR